MLTLNAVNGLENGQMVIWLTNTWTIQKIKKKRWRVTAKTQVNTNKGEQNPTYIQNSKQIKNCYWHTLSKLLIE